MGERKCNTKLFRVFTNCIGFIYKPSSLSDHAGSEMYTVPAYGYLKLKNTKNQY